MKSLMNRLFAMVLATGLASPLGVAGSLEFANVTKVINDVRIYRPSKAAQKARTGDLVKGRTSLQTGRRSRSELRFQDQTLTRLGSNSVFSFEQGSREVSLQQGTLLLQVPKNAGGARVHTPTVTAAVTGTTIMLEYVANKWAKAVVLEGSLDLTINGKKRGKLTLKAGEMAVFRANDKRLPKAIKVDVKRLMRTSALIDPDTFGDLPHHASEKIREVIDRQQDLQRDGFLVAANRNPVIVPAAETNETPLARRAAGEKVAVRRDTENSLPAGGDNDDAGSGGENDDDDGGAAGENENEGGPGDNDDGFGDNDDAHDGENEGPGDNDDGFGDNDDGHSGENEGPGDNDDGFGGEDEGFGGEDEGFGGEDEGFGDEDDGFDNEDEFDGGGREDDDDD